MSRQKMKLKVPVPETNRVPEVELKRELVLHTGWLAPDGSYYPCRGDWGYGGLFVSYNHDEYATEILIQLEGFTPKQVDDFGLSEGQRELLKRGYVRIDYSSVLHYESLEASAPYGGYTGKQLLTLSKLARINPKDENEKDIHQTIVTFLDKRHNTERR